MALYDHLMKTHKGQQELFVIFLLNIAMVRAHVRLIFP